MSGEEYLRSVRKLSKGPFEMNAYTTAMSRYFDFSGRSSRSEFWLFVLIYLVISVIASIVDYVVFSGSGSQSAGFVGALVALVHFLPSLAVGVRRLHDTGRSGWWLLINFIPLVGFIWYLVLVCSPSTPGSNRFGPNPHGADEGPSSSQFARAGERQDRFGGPREMDFGGKFGD